MQEDPATDAARDDRVRRRVVLSGFGSDSTSARAGLTHTDPRVRAAAIAALQRAGDLHTVELADALEDQAPSVRRRACELSVEAATGSERARVLVAVRRRLSDDDPVVVEAACWAVGERRDRRALVQLGGLAGSHLDPRCREAAIAALGAIGDRRGLPAVLGGLEDRPAVRRRAAVALAAFGGPEVEDALRRCLADRDWQVRQVAEDLLAP
jgi:HEAT repeat protein